jgi:hypothetical protein
LWLTRRFVRAARTLDHERAIAVKPRPHRSYCCKLRETNNFARTD